MMWLIYVWLMKHVNEYQFFHFLFVSSHVSPIVFGLVRTLLDVFTIFFSFLLPPIFIPLCTFRLTFMRDWSELWRNQRRLRHWPFWISDINIVSVVSRQKGTDTGYQPANWNVRQRGDLQGLSTEIWPYHTWHIVTYGANIIIDQW